MKVSELAYERVVTCDLCGRDFVVTQKFSHAQMGRGRRKCLISM